MIRLGAAAALTVAAAGIKVGYQAYDSTLYPYTILQPSSYRHFVYPDAAGHKIDFFAPGLGSFVTNVNIYATSGHMQNDGALMQAIGARHVKNTGAVFIMGKARRLMLGDFKGLAGHWKEERVEFADHGMTWHLTMSYDVRYAASRNVMLHMLRSFRDH